MIYQEVLDRTDYIPTENMDHEEWLEKRRSFIGGSDVGYIMELSDYGSAYTLYMEKKGKYRTEENEAMLRGSIMEPYIRELTRKSFPCLQIEEAPYIFRSKAYPFMGANVDGFILVDPEKAIHDTDFETLVKTKPINSVKGLGIHEIKSSQSGYGFGDDEIPDAYYAQIQHYLSVDDLQWALLTVYIIDKNRIRHYIILRDNAFITNMMIPQEKVFWEEFYLKDRIPAPIGLKSEEDLITGEFSGSEPLELEGELRDFCGEYATINQQIKALEEKKQTVKLKLMEGIVRQAQGNPSERKVAAFAGEFAISWITVERKDIDREAMKKSGIYEKFLKVSTYDRFTVTTRKK